MKYKITDCGNPFRWCVHDEDTPLGESIARFASKEDAELFVEAKLGDVIPFKLFPFQKAGIPEDAYRDGGSEANKFIEAMAHDAAKSPLPPSAKSLLSGKPFKAMSGFTSFKVRVSEPLPEPDVGEPCNVCGAERCECLPKPDAIVEKQNGSTKRGS